MKNLMKINIRQMMISVLALGFLLAISRWWLIPKDHTYHGRNTGILLVGQRVFLASKVSVRLGTKTVELPAGTEAIVVWEGAQDEDDCSESRTVVARIDREDLKGEVVELPRTLLRRSY